MKSLVSITATPGTKIKGNGTRKSMEVQDQLKIVYLHSKASVKLFSFSVSLKKNEKKEKYAGAGERKTKKV